MEQEIVVLNEQPESIPFSQTAGWNGLRLLLGNKNADNLIMSTRNQYLPKDIDDLEIEERLRHYKTANKQAVSQLVNEHDFSIRSDLQFIVNERKRIIVNVATNKHSLISINEIKSTIQETLEQGGFEVQETWKRYPAMFSLSPEATKLQFDRVRIGLGVYFGNIVLTKAIRVSWYFELETCTNPLTFLALKNARGMSLYLEIGTTRRIGEGENIISKTKTAVLEGIKQYKENNIQKIFNANGKKQLPMPRATPLVNALTHAYSIGEKTRAEILDTYKGTPKTAWNLAMIMSKIARDEENFRSNAREASPKLSAIALVILTAKNLNETIIKCQHYCTQRNI